MKVYRIRYRFFKLGVRLLSFTHEFIVLSRIYLAIYIHIGIILKWFNYSLHLAVFCFLHCRIERQGPPFTVYSADMMHNAQYVAAGGAQLDAATV